MKKMKVVSMLLAAVFMVTAAGCSKSPDKAPSDMVKTALFNSQNVKTSTVAIKLSGSVVGEQTGTKQQLDYTLNVDEKSDKNDPANLKMDAVLNGTGVFQGKNYDVQLQLKNLDGKIYLNLSKYPQELTTLSPQVGAIASMFANKWFFISSEQLGGVGLFPMDDSKLTPEFKQIKELASKTDFFSSLKYEGIESVGNVKSWKYTGIVDTNAVYDFVLKASEISKTTPPTEEEKLQMKQTLSKMNIPVEIYISTDDKVISGLKMSLNFTDDASKTDVKMNIDLAQSNINKPVEIKAPDNAEDLMTIVGGFAGAMGGETDTVEKVQVKK